MKRGLSSAVSALEYCQGVGSLGHQHRREQLRKLAGRQERWLPTFAEDAGKGAGIGAAVGGVGGLLTGLGLMAIPGVGPVVAAGWLAATAAGAVTGAAVGGAAGGIIGGLTDAGVSEDDAHVYAEGVRRGGPS